MYIDLIVLIILLVLVIYFFRRFSSFVYLMCAMDICRIHGNILILCNKDIYKKEKNIITKTLLNKSFFMLYLL